MTTELILKALDMAVQTRRQERLSVAGTIVHSDRGSQYCSQKFQGRLAQLNKGVRNFVSHGIIRAPDGFTYP